MSSPGTTVVEAEQSLRIRRLEVRNSALAADNKRYADRIAALESEVAALRAEVETAKDRAVKYQVERNTLVVENSKLRQQVEGMREDAERWRTLPAFLEKHQINYVMLLDDIDLARKESSNG